MDLPKRQRSEILSYRYLTVAMSKHSGLWNSYPKGLGSVLPRIPPLWSKVNLYSLTFQVVSTLEYFCTRPKHDLIHYHINHMTSIIIVLQLFEYHNTEY